MPRIQRYEKQTQLDEAYRTIEDNFKAIVDDKKKDVKKEKVNSTRKAIQAKKENHEKILNSLKNIEKNIKGAINLLDEVQESQSELDLLQKEKQESEEAKNAITQELTKAQQKLQMQKIVATAGEKAEEQVTKGAIAAIGEMLKSKHVI
jgi:hypothetical protein